MAVSAATLFLCSERVDPATLARLFEVLNSLGVVDLSVVHGDAEAVHDGLNDDAAIRTTILGNELANANGLGHFLSPFSVDWIHFQSHCNMNITDFFL